MNKMFAIDRDESLKRIIAEATETEPVELTVDGRVVARLVPEQQRSISPAEAVANIIRISEGISLDGIPFKELTHGGHKY